MTPNNDAQAIRDLDDDMLAFWCGRIFREAAHPTTPLHRRVELLDTIEMFLAESSRRESTKAVHEDIEQKAKEAARLA